MASPVDLSWFIGRKFNLTGVDTTGAISMKTWGDDFKSCQAVNFILDGITYSAIENPDDGYRSSMHEIRVTDAVVANTFPSCAVFVEYMPDDDYGTNDVALFKDKITGKTVLEIGTHSSDDYCPSFVGAFHPEAMAVNVRDSSPQATSYVPAAEATPGWGEFA